MKEAKEKHGERRRERREPGKEATQRREEGRRTN